MSGMAGVATAPLDPTRKSAIRAGVPYPARYVGAIVINVSMKTIDYDTRSSITKACMNRLCEATGLVGAKHKKAKVEKRIEHYLDKKCNLDRAGENVNFIVSTRGFTLRTVDTQQIIATHTLPNISFASEGDTDTPGFIAYVAKTDSHPQGAPAGRCCYVLECMTGHSRGVMDTIRDAFQLRFQEFVSESPLISCSNGLERTLVGGKMSSKPCVSGSHAVLHEYCNDIPSDDSSSDVFNGIGPVPVGALVGGTTSLEGMVPADPTPPGMDAPGMGTNSSSPTTNGFHVSHNSAFSTNFNPAQLNGAKAHYVNESVTNEIKDSLNLGPKPSDPMLITAQQNIKLLINKDWYHGIIAREQAEELVEADGDFFVRISPKDPHQFVLTGMQEGTIRHLLLMDADGVIRTKDRFFQDVPHLIEYHYANRLPITSTDSAILLRRPVSRSRQVTGT